MPITPKQTLTVINRETLFINGVSKVLGADSEYILLECETGRITVEGENLAIENLTKENGDLHVTGTISAVVFSDEKKQRRGIIPKLSK